jgi:endonuclease/exonuclease/phosphatase (EEP) superfamily protein YafD
MKNQYALPALTLLSYAAIQTETVEISRISPSATHSCRGVGPARVIHRARNSRTATVSADSASRASTTLSCLTALNMIILATVSHAIQILVYINHNVSLTVPPTQHVQTQGLFQDVTQ